MNYVNLGEMVRALKKAVVPVALHLDHCKDLKLIRECMDTGWSSVVGDQMTVISV
jgi:fructose-bisphosphate aldolase class II